jgi:hypothetical protein
MKILLEVLPLEKAKHGDFDFTEPVQFLFAYPCAGIVAANISTLLQ